MSDSKRPSPKLHGDDPAASSQQGFLDRKELAAAAFERTRMPLVITDACEPDHPIVLANHSFLALTGYNADEILGQNCRILQGKGTSPAAIAQIRATLRAERELDIELLNYRKDGSSFWNQLHLSPIYDDDGQLQYYFGSQIDVTEYRKVQELEAAEHRLLKEVDHRARNVLAIVDGIVRLSKSDDAALYAASVQRRVQALSFAHALLAETGWREVALSEIISRQVKPFDVDQVTLEGPDILVPAPVVQPLALVFHELAVNAAVHGSLSSHSGQLRIQWHGVPARNGFKLLWEEVGGPAPSTDRRPGFGTIMVGAIIEKQLQGELQRVWNPEGLVIEIILPLVSCV
ncbi:PAS domain-containing protein [Phyllobacterium endophyticum]|uniref:Blue-light-activated histidine kinase n=1 Tax=Phyllobacterium endophyticum TaxID=1149773 RepID=A0A2P7AVI3_9HYPH|nr:PAS domain-containing protein [Phyllobacterium endophyticum]MBB3234774.1 PAS domain S-box-containing protein [Phyllobacterium endophyticum]PSH58218.1 PAS domain S-box protein [Phyllobacterium endophyticum]TYR38896.1 PAS domain-containing protein [Phyllobacterium endophyticum]